MPDKEECKTCSYRFVYELLEQMVVTIYQDWDGKKERRKAERRNKEASNVR